MRYVSGSAEAVQSGIRYLAVTLALIGCGEPSAGPDAAADAPEVPADEPPGCTTRTPVGPVAVGSVASASNELSGLAASRTIDGLLWTHGDSGGTAVVESIDAATAAVGGSLRLTGVTSIDWEDLATAPCGNATCLYIGDVGDNNLVRNDIAIYEVVEPATAPTGIVAVASRRIAASYPDGPQNVEALVVDPRDGSMYGIAKVTAAAAAVYRYASAGGVAERVGTLSTAAGGADKRVTAADLLTDACGTRLLVRTRSQLLELRGGPAATVPELVAGTPVVVPVATEPQGEAVGWSRTGDAYFTISEGAQPTLYRVGLQ